MALRIWKASRVRKSMARTASKKPAMLLKRLVTPLRRPPKGLHPASRVAGQLPCASEADDFRTAFHAGRGGAGVVRIRIIAPLREGHPRIAGSLARKGVSTIAPKAVWVRGSRRSAR